jgi:predicted PurR-regulated permease PerM
LHLVAVAKMAEIERTEIRVPWATIFKVLAAFFLWFLWFKLWQIVTLILVAIIIAVGLAPAVRWLENRRWPRWLASATVVLLLVGTLIGFFILTGAQLRDEAQNLGQRAGELEQEFLRRAPEPLVKLVREANAKPDASMIAPYAARLGRAMLGALAVFVLAAILVLYLLIEAAQTYDWVRGFIPAKHRARFDRTSTEAREVAYGFVVGNLVTSTCAAIYFYIWLTALGVPASLLLALLAFVFDFIPVLGFYLSVLPAILMAASKSPQIALAMIPIYLSYDFIENYLIAPRVYGDRLRLSKVAVLLSFAVGAQLAGVVGAVLALPLAATFPVIDRLWLRRARFSQGDTVEAS